MNYFAHGRHYVDRPWFLAGTAVPDWLSAVDRRVRMRGARVAPFADGSGSPQAEIAAGVLQHLEDDRRFHQTPAFYETSGRLTGLFRDALGPEDGYRPGFLGHVATEMILDGVLIARQPDLLDRYYDALGRLDPARVEQAVNRMAREPTRRLAPLIPLFRHEAFLRDYPDPKRLLFRLNQVIRRIKLKPLPAQVERVISAGWSIVAENVPALLPASDSGTVSGRGEGAEPVSRKSECSGPIPSLPPYEGPAE